MDHLDMAFDARMGQNGPSAADMLHVPLDVEAMMTADSNGNSHSHSNLSPGFNRLFTLCANDDACLDHHHHFRQPRPMHKAADPLTPRLAYHGSGSTSLATPSSLEAHSSDYWGNFLDESALDHSNMHHGGVAFCQTDDCASECSSECDGSCPSQCGDTGHGVCCDDDACRSPQLCLDQDCQGASRPCMDESCLTDTALNERTLSGHVMTDGDKAAAAALASFGGDGQLQMYQSAFMQPSSSIPAASRATPSALAHLPESLPCGSLSVESMMAHGSSGFDGEPLQMALEYTLASHIMQYHDPSHGLAHTGPCLANDPAQLLARCTLPKFLPNHGAADPYLSHIRGHECGFQVQDPNTFAQHIFQEHRPVFAPNFYLPRLPDASFPGAQAGGNAFHQRGPYTGCSANSHSPFNQQFSPAPSPLRSLSVEHSVSTPPSSLTTPSPFESGAGVAEHGFTGASNPPLNVPESLPSPQDEPFCCRWLTGRGDAICGKRFDDDEQLQRHCKFDHLKQMKKTRGGFRCGWENCARDTCFTQRSKVERHMQVHTGYKPVRCGICGASLSAKQALDQHMRIHTGETPWVCKFDGCGCAFKQQSALTMHERTHTGDKPLECEICHKRFSESSNLSKHRRTHNVKGMHGCELCGKDFHRLDQLRRHMSTNHKDRAAEVDALLSKVAPKSQLQRVSKPVKTRAGLGGKARLKSVGADQLDMIGDQIQGSLMEQESS